MSDARVMARAGDSLLATGHIVVFTLDEQRFALPLGTVVRAVRVVAMTPLPKAPEIVCGVVNVQGCILPVVNFRKRFALPEKALALSDQLLIARTGTRMLAVVVDVVTGVASCNDQDLTPTEVVAPGTQYVKGIAKLTDGLVLIHDLTGFLSMEEEHGLDRALGDLLPTEARP